MTELFGMTWTIPGDGFTVTANRYHGRGNVKDGRLAFVYPDLSAARIREEIAARPKKDRAAMRRLAKRGIKRRELHARQWSKVQIVEVVSR